MANQFRTWIKIIFAPHCPSANRADSDEIPFEFWFRVSKIDCETIKSQEFVDRASDSITQLRMLFKSELENELEGS